MTHVLVLGAGPTGLTTAMLLAADGHRVSVVERNPDEPHGDAAQLWEGWERRGVKQFRMLHMVMPRWRMEMDHELPEVVAELETLGGTRMNLIQFADLPAEAAGARPGDERFDSVAARRPVLEAAVARVASRMEGVTVLRGVHVTALVTASATQSAIPRVGGVVTANGQVLHADLVVDASGRNSAVPRMLDAIGDRAPVVESEPNGFVYYSRYFRVPQNNRPSYRGWVLEHHEGLTVGKFACDNDVWAVGLYVSSRDRQLRALHDTDTWQRAVTLFPDVAEWAAHEPVGGVRAMAGTQGAYRRHVAEGRPVVTGFVAVGDAWATSNPARGAGLSTGVLHAQALRDTLREVGPADAEKLVLRFDELTEARLTPLYRSITGWSRHRLAEIDGDITGEPYETADPSWVIGKALDAAKLRDPDALRALADLAMLHLPAPEVLAAPGLTEKIMTLGANQPRYHAPGPSRAELLAAIGASRD
jgi:2-polyprenyl-6-methoxyphenol hydroxylase-like FAD-dependent oxidoreductase